MNGFRDIAEFSICLLEHETHDFFSLIRIIRLRNKHQQLSSVLYNSTKLIAYRLTANTSGVPKKSEEEQESKTN